MKAFVLLVAAVLMVTACEPEGGQKAETPSATVTPSNSSSNTPEHVAERLERSSSEGEIGIEGHVWVAKDIGGKDVADNSGVILSLNRGEATGKTGCNSYRGGYTITKDNRISFTPILTTRMACTADAMMEQERVYIDILSKSASFAKSKDGALILKAADGKEIRFVAE
jgi:heat shock protein HslJ